MEESINNMINTPAQPTDKKKKNETTEHQMQRESGKDHPDGNRENSFARTC